MPGRDGPPRTSLYRRHPNIQRDRVASAVAAWALLEMFPRSGVLNARSASLLPLGEGSVHGPEDAACQCVPLAICATFLLSRKAMVAREFAHTAVRALAL
jgi:hypothetical protein